MFSIITPTYNRAHTLDRVFNSLLNQSFKDFTWIVVDDGSSDNTKDLIEEWQTKYSLINIEYYILKKNKGKPYAVNFGIEKATENYTIIADSDDTFYPNTLEYLKNIWQSFTKEMTLEISAIWSLVENENHEIKGDKFPKDPWQVNFKQRVLDIKKPLDGDKWHCWRTEVLKKHPLFYDEKCHVGESHTWNAINKQYDFYCINKVFLTVFNSEVSLMNSKKPKLLVARAAYLSSFYGLKDVSLFEMVKFKYYRYLSFMYIKSSFNYSSNKLKLSFIKKFLSYIIFIFSIPLRVKNRFS